MATFIDRLDGQYAIVVGGGEGLARTVRRRFSQVIAVDPSRSLGGKSNVRLLREGEICFVAGRDAQPDRLPASCDCILLTFCLSGSEEPLVFLEPWIKLLRDCGRLILLEWSIPRDNDPAKSLLHAELLEFLEENNRLRRPSSRDMSGWLRRSALSHVRHGTEDSADLFTSEDRAFIAAEGLSHLIALGEGDSVFAHRLRSESLISVPLAIAHGLHKQIVPMEELHRKAREAEKATSTEPADRILQPKHSLTELIAAVLGDEVDDPAEVAHQLVVSFGEKALTAITDPQQIREVIELPVRHCRRLIDALELGRRIYAPSDKQPTEIHGPKDAYQYLASQMAHLKREHFRGLYMNVKGILEADEVISIGTLTSSLIHPREVFGPALEQRCHSVLVAHNHPSGDPNPSPEDIHLTRELADAGRLLGIELLDHLIIGSDSYVSLKEKGYF